MHRTRTLVAKALIVATIIVSLAPAAIAAPGGNGKGKGGGGATTDTCSSPALSGVHGDVGGTYTVTGCGFAPGTPVNITIGEANGCCRGVTRWADANGEVSYSGNVWAAGEYKFSAALQAKNGAWRVVAQWGFAV